ncbi:MAG: HAMP domain-containing sensor histidine kinase [Lactimicrobium sp.]|jgi:signal transduction histidine kinase|uniref:sensor histidine kinase n=1 Tax=Lactimicrobium sp. TaxID=2563780 RepID=UPI002F359F80
MKVFANPEIRREAVISLLVIAALSVLGFVVNVYAGLLVLLCGALLLGIGWYFTVRRYRAIARLSEELDEVLHGKKEIMISDMQEGELSILQNEIAKTTMQLKNQADHLDEDRKMMSRALADISHQLRTPLTSLHLNLQLLRDEQTSDKQKQIIRRQMAMSLNHMESLVEQLLKMSRLDAGTVVMKKQKISVSSLLDASMENLRTALDVHGVQVLEDVGSTQVVCDVYWTGEALGNIIKNCMEHVSEDGKITIAAKETPLYTEIVIHDNGCGFDESDLPHIFERFYKGKNASPNAVGIGLALASSVIAAQDGTIKAMNDHGACFIIRFYTQTI